MRCSRTAAISGSASQAAPCYRAFKPRGLRAFKTLSLFALHHSHASTDKQTNVSCLTRGRLADLHPSAQTEVYQMNKLRH